MVIKLTLAEILPVCPGATEDNIHTLIQVTPDSDRWFCRNDQCKIGYIIKNKDGTQKIEYMGKGNI